MKKRRLVLEKEIVAVPAGEMMEDRGGSIVGTVMLSVEYCSEVTPEALDIAGKTVAILGGLAGIASALHHCRTDGCPPHTTDCPHTENGCYSDLCHTQNADNTCLPPCLTA